MDYDRYFKDDLQDLQKDGRYRIFADLERRAGRYPEALHHNNRATQSVTIWCSNDYLGMGQHSEVVQAAQYALENSGAGAGGTRNISGTWRA